MTSSKRKKIEKNDDDIETVISKILLEDCDFDIATLLELRNHLLNSKDNVSIFLFSCLFSVITFKGLLM